MKFSRKTVALCVLGLSLTACGGGGGSGSSTSASQMDQNQSPGGIWNTQYTVTSGPNTGDTIKAEAIVSENGNLYFALRNQNNGCAVVGFGQATVTGDAVSGNLEIAIVTDSFNPAVNTGCTYPDGSTSGTATMSGTIVERSTMSLTVNATTSMGTALGSETYTWSFSDTYDTPSSAATVAGNFTDGTDTLSISATGAISEQDAATGCTLSGTIAPIDTQYNAYSLNVTISGCMGADAVANGVTLTGMATLDQSVSPAVMDFGLSTSINGQFVVIVDQVTMQ